MGPNSGLSSERQELGVISQFCGDLPTRNFTTGIFPEYRKLTGQDVIEKYFYKHETCWSCSLTHNKKLKFETPMERDPRNA